MLIECDFWLSSIEASIYNGLRWFWSGIGWFFGVVKMGKMLDFSVFARSQYRSDFDDFLEFLSRYMDGTDTLVFAAEYLFWNVNIPLMIWKNTIIVQYYGMFFWYNLFFVHFCNLNNSYLSSENALQLATTPAWSVIINWYYKKFDFLTFW